MPEHHKRHAKANNDIVKGSHTSRQPDVPKQKNQAEKEPNPNLPANARFLGHA